MKPQVGDIVQLKEEYVEEIGAHGGLVIQLIEWPPDARSVVDCVVFLDPSLTNPVQFQTRFVEVISRA